MHKNMMLMAACAIAASIAPTSYLGVASKGQGSCRGRIGSGKQQFSTCSDRRKARKAQRQAKKRGR